MTALDKIKDYRAKLKDAGRLLEARAVERCIAFLKKELAESKELD